MRPTRLLVIAPALLGAGLLSGSLSQVAALDRDLERAALERRLPVERTLEDRDCKREEPVRWRDS